MTFIFRGGDAGLYKRIIQLDAVAQYRDYSTAMECQISAAACGNYANTPKAGGLCDMPNRGVSSPNGSTAGLPIVAGTRAMATWSYGGSAVPQAPCAR